MLKLKVSKQKQKRSEASKNKVSKGGGGSEKNGKINKRLPRLLGKEYIKKKARKLNKD